MGSNHEKNGGRKSRYTLPLKDTKTEKGYMYWEFMYFSLSLPQVRETMHAEVGILTSNIKITNIGKYFEYWGVEKSDNGIKEGGKG